jgi:hypothetical protein
MNATENDSNDPARFPVSQNHQDVLEMMHFSLHSRIFIFSYNNH